MGNSRSLLGWLAIPPLLLAFVLAGMAVATEPKEDFEERARSQSEQPDPSDQQTPNGDRSQQPDDQPNPSQSGQPSDGQPTDGSQAGQAGRNGDGTPRPVVIQTDGGEIIIEMDENGRPTRVVAGESGSAVAPDRVFVPDPDGGVIGFRIEDGRLEPVETDDFGVGDYWLTTEPDGIEIIRPDGTQVVLRSGDDPEELAASRTSSTGVSENLPSDADGRVVIQSVDEFEPGFEVDPDSQPIAIAIDSGRITIELQSDGDLTASPFGTSRTASVDDLSAIRVDEDGNFEVVPLDEIGPDDTVLVPRDNGFDLVRPDGSLVEFRPNGENDGVTATEVSASGERRELEPNPDGSVTLDDGRTVGPIDFAEDGSALERLLDQTSDLPWPWVFGAIALLAALSIGTAVHLHRNRPTDQFDFSQFAVAGIPEDRFEKLLAVLKNEPDPAKAIRLAFYAVERGMAGLPHRRADETPFEWHGRVAVVDAKLAVPLAPICDLYALVRFAPGEATGNDRDLMIEHLRELNEVANRRRGEPAMAGV